MKHNFLIIDGNNNKQIKTLTNRIAANNKVNTLNNDYGAYRYQVVREDIYKLYKR